MSATENSRFSGLNPMEVKISKEYEDMIGLPVVLERIDYTWYCSCEGYANRGMGYGADLAVEDFQRQNDPELLA